MTAAEFQDRFLVHTDAAYRVAYYILESEDDAADAVQDLFAHLWTTRDELYTVHNPRAYCLTLIRNRCIDRLRRRQPLGEKEIPTSLQSADSPDRTIEARERLAQVMNLVKRLPERERKVLTLRVFDELSYDEISARTGINKLTLRVLLSNARSKLRKAIQK